MAEPRLILFFTRGVSLGTWDEAGMLDRELALYRRLCEDGTGISFMTYGGRSERDYTGRLGGIRLVCNRWGFSTRVYESCITRVLPVFWRGKVVVKSNQVPGADVALRAARRAGVPFIARCGYLHSDFMERIHGPDSAQAESARSLEREVFTGADRVVVTTSEMRDRVVRDYRVDGGKVRVIPNYVDTQLFAPANGSRADGDGPSPSPTVLFVGRLDAQKNPAALINAVKGLDVGLVMAGGGPLEESLREMASNEDVDVSFVGSVPHKKLPDLMRGASVFVLPSHFEGHPKTLIEAMSCGLPVIGADSPGIRELISHGETGFLCDTSAGGVRNAITEVLGDGRLREKMGRNARRYALENFSLDKVVEMERGLIDELA